MTSPKQNSEQLSEQALVVYRGMHEQVSFLKKQQWTITNYLLLVYGAVYAIKKEVMSSSSMWPELKWVLVGGVVIACIYGLAALLIVQCDLSEARVLINDTDLAIFGATERAHLGIKKERHPFIRGLFFTIALCLVLVFGAAIIILYVAA